MGFIIVHVICCYPEDAVGTILVFILSEFGILCA
jgi:hypothetical protein